MPGGAETLEGLAVIETGLGQASAQVIDLDLLRTRGRPLAQGLERCGLALGEGAAGVLSPLRFLTF